MNNLEKNVDFSRKDSISLEKSVFMRNESKFEWIFSVLIPVQMSSAQKLDDQLNLFIWKKKIIPNTWVKIQHMSTHTNVFHVLYYLSVCSVFTYAVV